MQTSMPFAVFVKYTDTGLTLNFDRHPQGIVNRTWSSVQKPYICFNHMKVTLHLSLSIGYSFHISVSCYLTKFGLNIECNTVRSMTIMHLVIHVWAVPQNVLHSLDFSWVSYQIELLVALRYQLESGECEMYYWMSRALNQWSNSPEVGFVNLDVAPILLILVESKGPP